VARDVSHGRTDWLREELLVGVGYPWLGDRQGSTNAFVGPGAPAVIGEPSLLVHWRLLLALVTSLCVSGCTTGRMYLGEVPVEGASFTEGPGTGLQVGVRGLDRLESNLYQDAFERELEKALARSLLFEQVERNDFDESSVDLVISIDKADLSVRRQVNLAYFPLALATLTLYIWVGGPIATDTQYFDVTLHAFRPNEFSELFSVSSKLQKDHWISLYSAEYWATMTTPCRGPAAKRVLTDLISQLDRELRVRGLLGGRERP